MENNVLFEIIKERGYSDPVKFDIGLDKLTHRNDPDGNQRRYFRVFLNGQDVGHLVAQSCGLSLSMANDAYNCIIVHGCGMDMAFWGVYQIYCTAENRGYHNMISQYYNFLGKKSRGKYPYQN